MSGNAFALGLLLAACASCSHNDHPEGDGDALGCRLRAG
jgi:hypothetical protein